MDSVVLYNKSIVLDHNLIRSDPDKVKTGVRGKNVSPDLVDQWLKADIQWRNFLRKLESLRQEKNEVDQEAKSLGKDVSADIRERSKSLREEIRHKEEEIADLRCQWEKLLFQLPNLPDEDIPVGKDESQNEVVRRWGEVPHFDFEVKDHLDLGESLGLIDVERASRVSGSRFVYLTGDLVLLEISLLNLAMESLVKEGFVPVIPPVMIKKSMEEGLGYAEHGGWDDMYVLDEDDLVLAATAEHPLVSRFTEELFSPEELPARFVGFSACFRREAGSYGKDTRGMLRVHQFNKVEMVSFCRPDHSKEEHRFLISLEEKLMQSLGLPYQVVQMCTGDLGHPAANKLDIETWMPGQNKYRETHSCSNCTDFQSRRLQIKYRKEDGESDFVHVLNGTVFSERPLIAILENFQQEDGSVVIPEVLRKWMGKDVIEKVKEKI